MAQEACYVRAGRLVRRCQTLGALGLNTGAEADVLFAAGRLAELATLLLYPVGPNYLPSTENKWTLRRYNCNLTLWSSCAPTASKRPTIV